jgi:hypothetical protein
MRNERGATSVLLGLRLAIAGGREDLARLALTAFGVALGVIFLLVALAGGSALLGRAERSAWQDTQDALKAQGEGVSYDLATAPDAALWLAVNDHHAGKALVRVHVAALGPRPPIPPGLDRLPAPGEVAVSPELRRLLAVTPADQLGNRFPGRVTTTIRPAGVRHPEHLVAVIGHTPQDLRQRGGADVVRGIATETMDFYPIMRFALMAAAIMLLFPVMIFIIMATRISAARREQRLAAIRMVGATRMQTAVMAAAEAALGGVLGSVAGLLGYLALRPALVNVRYGEYQGGSFYLADMVVPAHQIIAVMIFVPVLAVCVAVFALHQARITPLGISRSAPGRQPGAWRVLPVLVGVAGLGVIAVAIRGNPEIAAQPWFGLVGNACLLGTLVGAVVCGPWVCLVAGRAMARYGRRVTTLMAARRIMSAPGATYRAVGGVSLAVYLATLFAGTAGTLANSEPAENLPFDGRQRPGVVEVYAGGEPAATLAPLMSGGVVVARTGPGRQVSVACAELARVVDVTCPYPRDFPTIHWPAGSAMGLWATGGDVVEPGPGAAEQPVHALYVPTDGSVAAVERLRTRVASLLPRAIVSTRDDVFRQQLDLDELFIDLNAGLRIMSLFVIVVAGCSLTISLVNGLIERRRPFALLRASGVRVGELRRIMLLETAVPMVLTVVLGVALGSVPLLAASIALEGVPFPGPGLDFALGLGGAVLTALALTTLTFPLMNAATRYDAIRYE